MSVIPNYVPRAYKTITLNLVVADAEGALKFYNSAFGAEVILKLEDPDGHLVHAELKIDDTIFMLSQDQDQVPDNHSSVIIQLYTGDVEGVFENALSAGAEVVKPIQKEFYGDRAGKLKDPFGYIWRVATHIEDVPSRELQKRFYELYN